MKGVVFVGFTIILISLSEANFRKKPNIEIFEIRENQLTKKLNVQPVKLRYNLESEEKEIQASKLTQKKKETSSDIIKKIRGIKGLNSGKKSKQPVILIVAPEYLDALDSQYHSDQDDVINGFFDETRTQRLHKPGSEVVFNIVTPERARKALKQPRFPAILRTGGGIEYRMKNSLDRTNAPPPHRGDRPYVDDHGDDHY